MSKVLFISPVPTHAINAGNRKRIVDISSMVRELGHEVFFACFHEGVSPSDRKQMYEYWGREHCFFFMNEKFSFWKRMIQIVREEAATPFPYGIDECFPDGLIEKLKRLNEKYQFEIVFAEYTWCSKALEAFPKSVKRIIDTHDILTGRDRIFIKNHEKPVGIFVRKGQEQKGLRRADAIIAIQYREAAILRRMMPEKEVYTIGENMEFASAGLVSNKNILFVASNNKINQISLEWFLKEVYPRIKQRDPGCRLLIAGSIGSVLPQSSSYVKLGFVDDIKEVYSRVRLAVNPILGGTGLNIKTIEALSYAKPLVTTTVGAKGIKNSSRVVRIADEAAEFARNVVEICNDDDLAYDMSVKANRYIENYHNENLAALKKVIGT